MKCQEADLLLSLYLDNQLDELREKRLSLHLSRCSRCSQDLDSLAKTLKIIRSMAELEPSREFIDTVKTCLEQPQKGD